AGSSWAAILRIPFFLFDHRGRDLDLEGSQRSSLLLGEPADAAEHFVFGRKIAAQDDPAGLALARGELLYHGLAIANRKIGAKLLVAVALPVDLQDALGHFGLESSGGFVLFEIAI